MYRPVNLVQYSSITWLPLPNLTGVVHSYPPSMEHLIDQLTPNLSNASSLSSMLSLFPDQQQAYIKSWIQAVIEETDPGSLKDKDLLTYIKLCVKYPKDKPESHLEDFLSDAQLDRIRKLAQ